MFNIMILALDTVCGRFVSESVQKKLLQYHCSSLRLMAENQMMKISINLK